MTGRKKLREIREQLAAARAGDAPATPDTGGLLESLDRLADKLGRSKKSVKDTQKPTKGKKAEPTLEPGRRKAGGK